MRIKEKIREYQRVLQVARKPTKEEFIATAKICVIGLLLIGIVGFLIFLIFVLLGI